MNPILMITAAPFLVAFVVSVILTPLTIVIFNKLGFVIDPSKTPHPAHIHKEPVPKGGGLPVLVAIMTAVSLLLEIDSHLVAIAVASILLVGVGLIDDVRGMSPYLRLVINFLAAGIIVASGIGILYISNPLGGGMIDLSFSQISFVLGGVAFQILLIADLFALIWIPALMNAINWSSGVDGQISGVIAIAAGVLGLISLNYSADITQWPVATLAFATAGAYSGLAVYHFYPQKIMPGYSATSLAGLLLGVISILATAKVGALIMVLGIPLIDFAYIVFRRIIAGKSPVWGDKNHLHHKLLAMGWGKRRVALFYWLAAGVLGTVALSFQSRIKLLVIIGVALLMGMFLLWQYYSRYLRR